jgi:hypothetical protein
VTRWVLTGPRRRSTAAGRLPHLQPESLVDEALGGSDETVDQVLAVGGWVELGCAKVVWKNLVVRSEVVFVTLKRDHGGIDLRARHVRHIRWQHVLMAIQRPRNHHRTTEIADSDQIRANS